MDQKNLAAGVNQIVKVIKRWNLNASTAHAEYVETIANLIEEATGQEVGEWLNPSYSVTERGKLTKIWSAVHTHKLTGSELIEETKQILNQ